MRKLINLTCLGIFLALVLIVAVPAFSADPMDETNVSTPSSSQLDQKRPDATSSKQLETKSDMERKPEASTSMESAKSDEMKSKVDANTAPSAKTEVEKQPSAAESRRLESNADNREKKASSADMERLRSNQSKPNLNSNVTPGARTDVESQQGAVHRRVEKQDVAPSHRAESGAVEREHAVSGQTGAKAAAGLKAVGFGVVMGVDRPDNCLRIRQEASPSSALLGCAKMGDKIELTGAFSQDGRWAQLTNGGWVFMSQIKTDIKTPKHARAHRRSSSAPRAEMYEEDYPSDWEAPAGAYDYEEVPDTDYYGPTWYGYRSFRPYGGFYSSGRAYGPGFGVYGPGFGAGFGFRR